jgi:hypothetical protein
MKKSSTKPNQVCVPMIGRRKSLQKNSPKLSKSATWMMRKPQKVNAWASPGPDHCKSFF